jgi:hypothetical protein
MRLALKIVMQNDGDFMDAILLYALKDRRYKLVVGHLTTLFVLKIFRVR